MNVVKCIRNAAAALLAAGLFPLVAAADSPLGIWESEPMGKGGYAHIRIAPCDTAGDQLCGRITRILSSDRSDLVGVELLRNMTAEGSGRWGKGDIYSPDKNRYFDSHMILNGDGLEVRGCLAGLCKSQKWARVQ